MEFDDLSSKSREAEKEVNMLQMKIQEVTDNLSKYRKDAECKYHSIASSYTIVLLLFLYMKPLLMEDPLLMHISHMAWSGAQQKQA